MVIGQRDFLNRCPICKAPPGTDLAAEIDSQGLAQCRSCGRNITKQVLYAYWDAEEAKFSAQQKKDTRKAFAPSVKKWWQFWK